MHSFDDYLAMYRVGDETLKAALDGRLAPQAHYEAYFNVAFPKLTSGLSGVGDPIGPPTYTTLPGSDLVAVRDVRWMQRVCNASGTLTRVDGILGPRTKAAFEAAVASVGGGSVQFIIDGGRMVGVVLKKAAMFALAAKMQVADPGSPGAPPPPPPEQPVVEAGSSQGSSSMLIAAAAVLLGVWAATRG
ncbi:MAG: hypothetical protein ACRCSL_04780 [Microbacterium sp.]